MALPKLKTPEYRLLLPSTQEEIKYRPFLVKEQKILMIAQESEDENQLGDAMGKLVSNCTFGALNVNESPISIPESWSQLLNRVAPPVQ